MCRIDPSPPEAIPSSCPNPSLGHHERNQIVSPVLDALGSLAETPDNDVAFRTDTWAKSIPFGKSPPNDVDGEFASGSPLSFPTNTAGGGFSDPSSASPPPARRRPLSYGNHGYLNSNSNPSRQQSTDRQKSHSISTPLSNQAPPPHLPQAHFYGAPDVDLPFPDQGRTSTEGSHSFCAFDSISSPSFKTSRMGGTVLLTGTDGTLEVLAIEDRKTRLIGKLSGLNGRVIEAKMLTCNSSHDPLSSSRPHVAVVLHGPYVSNDDEGQTSSGASETNEVSSGRQASAEKRSNRDDAKYYQSRVEIYSVRTGDHISTLFTTKPTPCLENIPGMPIYAPSPVGNLKLYASGNYVILASGVSGEVYIYGVSPSSAPDAYQCYGKTWTDIQSKQSRRYSTSSSSTDPDGPRNDSPQNSANLEKPILALRGRWLAIVPPSSSTYRTPLHGTVPPSLFQSKVLGLETRSPPARPTINCATDVGEGESLFDKVARGVAQELVRGARWMGDQGLQAWNNYWNKEQTQNQSGRRSQMDLPQQVYNPFPPTHAQDTQTASPSEPDLVSIIDLKRLEDGSDNKNAISNPIATFQVPNGCSFLSFSPNGLMLLTASKKGDVQYVWDLLQAKYCRAGAFLTDNSMPCANIRQIARYARLTTSSIVDVIWTVPTGDRLAIITRKGTVHVFDMPRSAFQWPPFRRARPVPNKTSGTDSPADDLSDRANAQNPLSAAFKLVGGKTQPIFAAVRGRTPSAASGFPVGGFGISSAAGVRSGKAVAAGLSKSVGAATGTVNTLRHVGENRLHLHGLARDPIASRVTWITHRGQPFLGLVDNGVFRLHRIRRTMSNNKHRSLQSVIGGKEIEYKLPANLQNPSGPMSVGGVNPESTVHASLALPSWNPQSSSTSKPKRQPLSQAEIETNVPYQPFHTDQSVNLYIISPESEETDSMLSEPTGQWIFGEDISMTKLHVRPFSSGGDDDDDDDTVHEHSPGFGGDMENLISLGNSTGNVEEVVITTRRKKKHSLSYPSAAPEADMDDGFFEDDCEVLDFARDRV